MRFILQYILPLAFPAAMYFLWMLFHKKEKPKPSKGTWFWLFASGVALTFIALVTFRQFDGEKPGGVYQPPVFKDGKIVPGHVIRDE